MASSFRRSAQDHDDIDEDSHAAPLRRLGGLPSTEYGGVSNAGADLSKRPFFLDAWSDPVAGIAAYTPCVHTCNLYGDGDWRLVIADEDRKLKVWKGTQKQADYTLLDTPVAITSFISETTAPRQPNLAVAAGSHIYIYRNLRPYYKFVLPPEDVNTEEKECWAKVMAGEIVVGEAVDTLTRLQDAGVVLTTRSLQIMNMGDPDKKLSFVEQWQGQPLVATTVITCMDVIKHSIDEPDAVSCLVCCTESGRVLILNPQGNGVTKNIWVGVTAAFMTIQGELGVGYRITVAGRDGKLYTIKNGDLQQTIIQLDAPAVGLVRMHANVLVGCMNNVIHSYTHQGHKHYTLYLPSPILTMQRLEVQNARMAKCLLVALRNGEVRIYNEKILTYTLHTPSPVTALWFGKYGREDNTLIVVTKSGALDIKILPRTAVLDAPPGPPKPPPEQDIPLQVPKKTRLYVEQTQREREQAVDMHRIFQRDLARLRLTTARAYVKVLTDGQGANAFTSSTSLSLNLASHGLGPRFKLIMTVRNDGSSHVRDVPVVIKAPESLYRLGKKALVLPYLAPSLSYVMEVDVHCIDPASGLSDAITVIMLSKHSSLPILQAQLKMPVSEIPED